MYTIYTKESCGPCQLLMNYLESKGINYNTKSIEQEEYMNELINLGYQSVPVLVRDNQVLFHGFRPDLVDQLLKEN